MAEANDNPYVGPRPYERADRALFFGRDSEIRQLLSLVIAHRVVLLYATSGAGKTSLLNAGLLPLLEEEEGFEVFPPARVAGARPSAEVANAFADSVVENWRRDLGGELAVEASEEQSLAQFLASRDRATDRDGFAKPRLVVFDQFEEIFTLHQQHWRQRDPFFAQVAEALSEDPLLRVVIAIREDYMAQLDRYGHLLPERLRTRLQLERLRGDAALAAVTQLAALGKRRFAPGVAEQLVRDLLELRVDTGRGEIVSVEGEYVEPVQLQVACRSLWEALPEDVVEITEAHLRTFGDVDEVLSRFYSEAVDQAARAGHIRERELRGSLERTFITSGGTRGTVYAESGETGGIPGASIDELERRHLIRAEFRAGARWLELTHDRLIEPIRTSNRAFFAELRRRRLRWGLALAVAAALVAGVAVWQIGVGQGETQQREASAGLATTLMNQHVANCRSSQVTTARPGATLAATFSAGGGLLETASSDGSARFWDCTTGRELHALLIPVGPTSTAAFGRSGALLLTAGGDKSATVWSVADGRRRFELSTESAVVDAAFTSDGRSIAVATDDGGARVVDAATGESLLVVPAAAIRTVAVSPDGNMLATGSSGGGVRFWDVRRGVRLGSVLGGAGPVTALAFTPDGRTLAIGHESGGIDVADVRSLRLLSRLRTSLGGARSLAFGPDGVVLAAGGASGTLRLWAPAFGEQALERLAVGTAAIRDVAFSADGGRLASGLESGRARVLPTTRARVIACARAAYAKRDSIRYAHLSDPAGTEKALEKRRVGITKRTRLPDVPNTAGPETLIIWCYWQAGGPDPEGQNFRGNGFTGAMVQQGRPVVNPKPGDVAFYTFPGSGGFPSTAALYVGEGKILRFLTSTDRLVIVPATLSGTKPRYRSYLP